MQIKTNRRSGVGSQSSFYESCLSTARLLMQPRYLLMLLALAVGLALFAPAPNSHAQGVPAACDGSSPRPYLDYNRQGWCGFFNNEGWTDGPAIRGGTYSDVPSPGGSFTDPTAANPGVPQSVDTAQEFVDMILSDLNSSDPRAVTGAQFIILSTLGITPEVGDTVTKTVTPEQVTEWTIGILSYANESEDGAVSTGRSGSITWYEDTHLDCGETNTYYQIDQDDVAPFQVNTSNTPGCDDPSFTEEYITFRDNDGNILLQIRRICLNPAGEINPVALDVDNEVGTLGDLVFEDVNRNGVFDPGVDVPIPGVTIALYDMTASTECNINEGQLISTTTTDENGRYQFTNLPITGPEGDLARYAVVVTDENGVLNGYTNSRGAEGVNENGQDPNGYCMTLTLTEWSNQTGDFGYYRMDQPGEEQAEEELAATGSPMMFVLAGAIIALVAGILIMSRRAIRLYE